jgi:hypothetical protein
MKNIKLLVIALLAGTFAVNAGNDQERQDRQRQQQQERQDQERRQHDQHRQDRTAGIDQLPEAVKETLRDDYDDWRATEASRASDPDEEEPFFMIKLEHKEEVESKVVMINTDGEVIEEEEVMILDQRRREMDRNREHREGDRRDDRRRDREGRQYTPVVFIQERQQERSAPTDSLPQQVESTLMQDFGDWSPTQAHLATDPEQGTTYYIVKVHNVAEGETKIVRITSQGEVIDEEDINPLDGIDDAERRREHRDRDDDDDGWF